MECVVSIGYSVALMLVLLIFDAISIQTHLWMLHCVLIVFMRILFFYSFLRRFQHWWELKTLICVWPQWHFKKKTWSTQFEYAIFRNEAKNVLQMALKTIIIIKWYFDSQKCRFQSSKVKFKQNIINFPSRHTKNVQIYLELWQMSVTFFSLTFFWKLEKWILEQVDKSR